MAPPPNPAPQSKASLAIVKVNNSLGGVNSVIGEIRTPLSELVINLTALNTQYINPGLDLCRKIKDLCNSLTRALQLCNVLTPFPVVGALVGRVKKVIESMRIEDNVKQIVGQIEGIFTKARDKTIGPITNTSSMLLTRLQKASDLLPTCQQTLAMMTTIFGLVDLGVYVLFDKGPKDPLVDNTIDSLEQMSIQFGQSIEAIQNSLKPIKDFTTGDALQKFKSAIAGPLSDDLKPLREKIGQVQDKIGPLVNTLSDAFNRLEPLKKVLDWVSWLVDRTLGPVIDAIINHTPLRGLVDDVSNKIQDAMGVADFKNKVSGALEASLENLQTPLQNLLDQTASLTKTFEIFANDLNDLRQHPANKLFAVITKGLKTKYPQLFQQISAQNAISGTRTARLVATPIKFLPEAASYEDEGVGAASTDGLRVDNKTLLPSTNWSEGATLDTVEDRLCLMNNFVKTVEEEEEEEVKEEEKQKENVLATSAPGSQRVALTASSAANGVGIDSDSRASEVVRAAAATSTPPAELLPPAPKLGYAFFEGDAVSVMMRVDHSRVVDKQTDGRTEALAPMSGNLAVRLAHRTITAPMTIATATTTVSPSGGKAPKLDEFIVKCASLTTAIAQAKAYVGRIGAAAQQADTQFTSFAPEAAQFIDHLIVMLGRLDPLFTASISMLELPLKYRTALTRNLSEVFKEAGTSASVTSLVPAMFATIDKADAIVKGVRDHLAQAVEQSKTASTAYKAFFDQTSQIRSSSLFPKSLGTNVTSLSILVATLQTRLDGAANSLTTLSTIGQTLTQHPDQLVDPTATWTKLNELYGRLGPLVDATVAEVQQLPPLVEALYAALTDAYADVQILYGATSTVVKLCRDAEAQVVRADIFREQCTRINTVVAPFEGLLAQLQVPADPQLHKRMLVAAAAATPPPPAAATPATPPAPPSPAVMKAANDALGGAPFDILTNFLGPALFQMMNTQLDKFVHIGDLDAQLTKLASLKQATVKEHCDKFSTAIANLVKVVEPKAAAAANAVATNPLLDEASSQSLIAIVKEIQIVMASAVKPASK